MEINLTKEIWVNFEVRSWPIKVWCSYRP